VEEIKDKLTTANDNFPFGMELFGVPNLQHLENAFAKLLQRHEIFRTIFVTNSESDVTISRILADVPVLIDIYYVETLDDATRKQQLKDFIRPFDISRPPLIRIKLIRSTENRSFLCFDAPRIVVDSISHDSILKEFTELYSNQCNDLQSDDTQGEEPQLEYSQAETPQAEIPRSEISHTNTSQPETQAATPQPDKPRFKPLNFAHPEENALANISAITNRISAFNAAESIETMHKLEHSLEESLQLQDFYSALALRKAAKSSRLISHIQFIHELQTEPEKILRIISTIILEALRFTWGETKIPLLIRGDGQILLNENIDAHDDLCPVIADTHKNMNLFKEAQDKIQLIREVRLHDVRAAITVLQNVVNFSQQEIQTIFLYRSSQNALNSPYSNKSSLNVYYQDDILTLTNLECHSGAENDLTLHLSGLFSRKKTLAK
jgi:hypothetical protein